MQELDLVVNEFVQAALDQLEECQGIILDSEEQGKTGPDWLKLLRIVHSLKGNAASLGYPLITQICHNMEDFLEKPSQDNFFQKALKYSDLLQRYIELLPSVNTETLNEIKQDLMNLSMSGSSSGYRAIIVDPSATMRMACRETLEANGVKVVEQTDGYSAFGRILNEDFDFIFTGYETGNLTGTQLLGCVATTNKSNLTKVLISSGRKEHEIEKLANAFFVTKSADMRDKIDALVKSVIQNQSIEESVPKKIHYIDDDAIMHKIITSSLNRLKNRPSLKCFAEPKDGLLSIENDKPALLLLDSVLVKTTGLEVLSQLRKNAHGKTIPVIFITANDSETARKQFLDAGAIGVIAKPINPKNFGEIIVRIWNQRTTCLNKI